MSSVQSSIASIELLRKQLEDANVKALRLEARCQTISTSNANLEKLLLEINKTNSHMDEEMQNVEKWNRFYDGHLQNGYRSLAMVKEASNKKWQQYQDDAKRITSHNEALRKEVQDRKDRYDKNVELIWKKIPGFSEKLEKEQMISSLKEKLKSLKLEQNKSGSSPAPTNDRNLLELKEKRLQLEREEAHKLKILEGLNKALTLNENSKKSSPVLSPAMENVNMEAITMSNGQKELEKRTDDSGISLSDDQKNDEVVEVTVCNESLDETTLMFPEAENGPMEIEGPKTPTKAASRETIGRMNTSMQPITSTPRLSANFLQPKQKSFTSAPPNLTPVVNSSLSFSKSTTMITPMKTQQRLDVKGSLAKFQSMRNAGHSQIEVTPSKSNLKLALPKTPVSMLSKQTNLPQAKTPTMQFPMNKGLLAPTPEKKDTVMNVTPTKQVMSTPMTPNPPTKNHISQLANSRSIQNIASNITSEISLDSKAGATATAPDSKKLKPSHSFTKCQKPNSLEVKKPNECGDSQQPVLTRLDKAIEMPSKVNSELAYGTGKTSEITIADGKSSNQNSGPKGDTPFEFNFAGSTFGENGAFEMESNFSGADSNSQEGGFGGGSGFDFSSGAAFGSDGADCFGSGEGTDFGKSNPFAGDGDFSSAESPFPSSFSGFQF